MAIYLHKEMEHATMVKFRINICNSAAEHYYCFLTALREQLIQNTTANHAIIN